MIPLNPSQFYVRLYHFAVEIRTGSDQQAMLFGKGSEGFLLPRIVVRRIDLEAFQAIIDQLLNVLFSCIGRMRQNRCSAPFFYLADGGDAGDIFQRHESRFSTPEIIPVEIDIGGKGSVAADIWPKARVVAILLPAEDRF